MGSRVGLVLTSLEGVVAEYALCFGFKALNNERLKLARDLKSNT